MKRKANSESGFTLLELLISLAMIGVVVTACLMAVRMATASREVGVQKNDLHQRLRVIHEQLNSTLRSTHLVFVSAASESLIPEDEDNEEQTRTSKILAFEGKPESLRFVTFSDKVIGSDSSPRMHEVHFYLQKNEDTGLLEMLLTERNFSPQTFFSQEAEEREPGQTMRIAQDVAYLKFRYYYELLDDGKSGDLANEKPVKNMGKWTDKISAEPIDFKSNINDNENTGINKESGGLPKAVEVSVGLWGPVHPEKGSEPQLVELQPVTIPFQTGLIFERPEQEEEANGALKE